MRNYRSDLEKLGHTVSSRWIEGGHEIDKECSTEATQIKRRQFAIEDYQDLVRAECCISFTEVPRTTNSRGGRHVEFGIALGLHKTCVIIGPSENVFHCLPWIERYDTWEDFLKSPFWKE